MPWIVDAMYKARSAAHAMEIVSALEHMVEVMLKNGRSVAMLGET